MKILVTGATGFLGGALVECLLARGARDIRVTARAGARRDRLQAAAARHPEARLSYVPSNLTVRADAAPWRLTQVREALQTMAARLAEKEES